MSCRRCGVLIILFQLNRTTICYELQSFYLLAFFLCFCAKQSPGNLRGKSMSFQHSALACTKQGSPLGVELVQAICMSQPAKITLYQSNSKAELLSNQIYTHR